MYLLRGAMSHHNFPFAVAFSAFTADIVFILQGFHYSLYGAERFSGNFNKFLLFYIQIFYNQF
jgi:hypothetical protein